MNSTTGCGGRRLQYRLEPTVVAREEFLVKVDDGIAALGGRAELIENRPDIGLTEIGHQLLGHFEVQRNGVVHLLEERRKKTFASGTEDSAGDAPKPMGSVTLLLNTP